MVMEPVSFALSMSASIGVTKPYFTFNFFATASASSSVSNWLDFVVREENSTSLLAKRKYLSPSFLATNSMAIFLALRGILGLASASFFLPTFAGFVLGRLAKISFR